MKTIIPMVAVDGTPENRALVAEILKRRGFKCVLVPETALFLSNIGVTPELVGEDDFHRLAIKVQMCNEEIAIKVADKLRSIRPGKYVLVCGQNMLLSLVKLRGNVHLRFMEAAVSDYSVIVKEAGNRYSCVISMDGLPKISSKGKEHTDDELRHIVVNQIIGAIGEPEHCLSDRRVSVMV